MANNKKFFVTDTSRLRLPAKTRAALKNTQCLWLTGDSSIEARVCRHTGRTSKTRNEKAGVACKPRRARPVAHRDFVALLARDNQHWPSERASSRHATGHAEALGIFQSCPSVLVFLGALIGCAPAEQSLEVTATAYNSLASQTHGNPEVGAWGDRLDPDTQIIAVSRDLLSMGLTHNTEVEIDGMAGTWLVRDKLNRRFTERIDIFMGKDLEAAREFGKQTVTIRWQPDP